VNDSHPLAGRETTPLTSEATLAPVPLFQETVAAHTATALRAPRQCRRLDARIDQQQHIIRRPLTKMRPAGRGQPALGCRAASMLVVCRGLMMVHRARGTYTRTVWDRLFRLRGPFPN
jgi:hypothetical protein